MCFTVNVWPCELYTPKPLSTKPLFSEKQKDSYGINSNWFFLMVNDHQCLGIKSTCINVWMSEWGTCSKKDRWELKHSRKTLPYPAGNNRQKIGRKVDWWTWSAAAFLIEAGWLRPFLLLFPPNFDPTIQMLQHKLRLKFFQALVVQFDKQYGNCSPSFLFLAKQKGALGGLLLL